MAPNFVSTESVGVVDDTEKEDAYKEKKIIFGFKTPLKWTNIVFITWLHILALYALLTFPYFQKLKTFWFAYILGQLGGLGVTGGAHRLWTHRSYKAKLPVRIFLLLCYTVAGQNRLSQWVLDHRVHHKFSETDADPHDSRRGLFFSHVGWLMMKKHPAVILKGKQVDCRDIFEDPVVRFHEKYFVPMKIAFCFVLPTLVPPLLWGESWYWGIMQTLARYAIGLNCTWSVNSFAHLYGTKPYNKHIKPSDNLGVAIAALGEGWHNYHHTFPYDYKAAELGNYKTNITTMFIDACAKLGLTYDLKYATEDSIKNVQLRQGDITDLYPDEIDCSSQKESFTRNIKRSLHRSR